MLIIDVEQHHIGVFITDTGTKRPHEKRSYFCSLAEVVDEYRDEEDHHLLLPEQAYIFHTLQMERITATPFTITEYKTLREEKKKELVRAYGCDPRYIHLMPHVGSVFGDGCIKGLLGKTGKITRLRHMYMLKPATLLLLRQAYHTALEETTIVPRHLATMHCFMEKLQRDTFLLVMITNSEASLYQIQKGWYDKFGQAPLGTHILLEAAEDQGVQKFLFDEREMLTHNVVAQKLLLDSLGFYSSSLAEWIAPYIAVGTPLVLCCSLVNHPFFLEVVQASLQSKGAFVLPFSALPLTSSIKHLWQTDFAVAAYLHL